MNTSFRIFSFGLITSTLVACGGGSGGAGLVGANDEQGGEDPASEPELVIELAAEPLEPKVFNLVSTELSTQRHFSPGQTISSTWFASIGYDDGSSLEQGENHLYNAKVYLSNDAEIEIETDLELFSIECSIPITNNHACGPQATFQTIYSPNNENRFETISIPLEKEYGLVDYSVDSSIFLNSIPKYTNVIIEICMVSEPDKCDQSVIDIELY